MAVKKGDAAREAVKNKIIEAFGSDFVTFSDKKIYVQAQDGPGGEVLQFAITMTMPKVQMAKNAVSAEPTGAAGVPVATPTELSAADKEKVADLMARLGISN